ncbi:MAG: GH36 C-terminal domain-containing protein [Clostridia bacterium]|nr:GH36 C-terminal domain-containing protein [Clostridia bacterium]
MRSVRLRAFALPLLLVLLFFTFYKHLGEVFFMNVLPVYLSEKSASSALPDDDALRRNGGAFLSGSSAVLLSGDSRICLDVQNDRLFVTGLSTLKNGENRVSPSSVFDLPSHAVVNGAVLRLSWRFNRAEIVGVEENGVEAVGVSYGFHSVFGSFGLTVTCISRPGIAGPFEFRVTLENGCEKAARIIPGTFASFTLKKTPDETLMRIKKESGMAEGYTHYTGQFFEGSGICSEELKYGKTYTAWVNTYQSFNESGFLPMVYLDSGSYGCYAALEWSSGEVSVRSGRGGVTVGADLDCVSEKKYVFSTKVPAGECFEFPPVYLGVYDGSPDDGSNVFKKWFFSCKAPCALRDHPNEPLTQMDFQSGLDTYGIEAVKWDYGWWSGDRLGNWETLEGSWQLRDPDYLGVLRQYGCDTLSQFGALTKARGKSLTVYVLLHDTLDKNGMPTDAFGPFNSKTHPEWFSDRLIDLGMGNTADLGNEECVSYLQGAMAAFFNENSVTTWRSDFEPICYSSDKENRHDANGSDVQYWCSVGFRELVSYLYDNVDGFRYESCSSGGSMKDLFTATLAVVINCDDAANYAGMRATFYDSSYVIHPAQLQMPCNADFANPDKELFYPKAEQGSMSDADFRDAMINMGFRTQCLGVPMFSSWTGTLLTDYYARYAEIYKTKLRPLIRNGSLYHILPRPDGVHWDGVQYACPDASGEIKGAAFLFKPSPEAGETSRIFLRGLDPDAEYRLVFEDRPEQNLTATGKELSETGTEVSIPESVGSEIIWIMR